MLFHPFTTDLLHELLQLCAAVYTRVGGGVTCESMRVQTQRAPYRWEPRTPLLSKQAQADAHTQRRLRCFWPCCHPPPPLSMRRISWWNLSPPHGWRRQKIVFQTLFHCGGKWSFPKVPVVEDAVTDGRVRRQTKAAFLIPSLQFKCDRKCFSLFTCLLKGKIEFLFLCEAEKWKRCGNKRKAERKAEKSRAVKNK